IGYGVQYPIFWIDRFHPHTVKQHTAFVARNCEEVDAFHAAALNAGGIENGSPGFRDVAKGYPPGYYAAFVLDPDGNNIEAVFREPNHTSRPPGGCSFRCALRWGITSMASYSTVLPKQAPSCSLFAWGTCSGTADRSIMGL